MSEYHRHTIVTPSAHHRHTVVTPSSHHRHTVVTPSSHRRYTSQGLLRTISRDRTYFGNERQGAATTRSGRLAGRAGRGGERAMEKEDVEDREQGISPPELQLGRLTGQEVLLIWQVSRAAITRPLRGRYAAVTRPLRGRYAAVTRIFCYHGILSNLWNPAAQHSHVASPSLWQPPRGASNKLSTRYCLEGAQWVCEWRQDRMAFFEGFPPWSKMHEGGGQRKSYSFEPVPGGKYKVRRGARESGSLRGRTRVPDGSWQMAGAHSLPHRGALLPRLALVISRSPRVAFRVGQFRIMCKTPEGSSDWGEEMLIHVPEDGTPARQQAGHDALHTPRTPHTLHTLHTLRTLHMLHTLHASHASHASHTSHTSHTAHTSHTSGTRRVARPTCNFGVTWRPAAGGLRPPTAVTTTVPVCCHPHHSHPLARPWWHHAVTAPHCSIIGPRASPD